MKQAAKLLVFVLTFFTVELHASNLDSAISKALLYNPEIKLEKARLRTVRAQYYDAYGNFLPTINATAQMGKQKKDIQQYDDADDDELKDDDYRQISLSQPLFNGYKSYNYKKQLGYEVTAAEYYYSNVSNEIILQVIETYLNVYRFRETLLLKEEGIKLTKQILEYAKQRNMLGQLGGKDLIEYEVGLNNIIIEKLDLQRELVLAEEDYRQLVGEVDYDLELSENTLLTSQEEELLSMARINNPLLQHYYNSEKSAQSNVNVAKGSFLPTVSFETSFTREDNVDYLGYKDLETKSYYFNFSVPIFQAGAEYAGLKQAKEDAIFAEQETLFYQEKIRQELSKYFTRYHAVKQKLESSSELLKLYEDKIIKEKQQVSLGEGDILDLLSMEIELLNLKEGQISDKTELIYNYHFIKILSEGGYQVI